MDDWSFDVFSVNDSGDGHALKYVGYEPRPEQPWAWYCPGCPEADIGIARDSRSDIDDAMGAAVARAAWIRAADKRRDLGPPEPGTHSP